MRRSSRGAILATTLSVAALTGIPAGAAADPLPPLPPASDFSAHVDNPWFPLIPGTRYVYLGIRDGKPMRDVVTVTHRTRTIEGVPCAVVEDRSYVKGRLFERTTDWYSQDSKGNVWYLGEATAELDAKGKPTSTSGSWLAGRDGARPGISMTANPRVGQSYQQEISKGQAEDFFAVIGVFGGLVGTPRNSVLTKEWTPLEPGAIDHKLYVRGVGIVLEHAERGGDEHAELVSLTRAA